MKNILIIDKMHESIVPMLDQIGYASDYRPEINREEILGIIGQYEGLIVRSKTDIDAALIKNATKLKFVARAGAGLDKLDLDLLEERNITVINAPEGNRRALAEHVLAMILSLLNKLNVADLQVRNNKWDREGNRGYELKGKTIGLIGYGNMGKSVAKLLTSLECNVIANDKYAPKFEDSNAISVSLDQFFGEADIVSLHVPLTTETNGMVNVDFFKRFRKKIFFINTARGEVVILSDLLDAIDNGIIIGAGLDVLENEKIDQLSKEEQVVFDRLIKNSRVILTPHVGGWTFESYERINQVLVDKIAILSETGS